MGEVHTFIAFVLLLQNIRHSIGAATVCPKPVVDDIGKSYHTQERFNKIRKENNILTSTNYITHGDTTEEVKYVLKFCNENNWSAMEEQNANGGKGTTIAKINMNSVLIGAEDWLLIQYKDGDNYPSKHCGGKPRQAWISIRCEEGGETPVLKLIEEPRFNTGERHADLECYHLFEYNHPAACSTKPLSGGTIFVIVLLVLIAAYFLFGFLYKRFVTRAKGRDQIPNHSFWEAFGNLMADGCTFVCRRDESSNTYKGMAEQLNIDDSDDEEEDILPM